MTDATERGWMEKCDIFLDPFTLPADRDSLEFSMNKVSCLLISSVILTKDFFTNNYVYTIPTYFDNKTKQL